MDGNPEFAAIAVDVDDIDDHRQSAFSVESGVSLHWTDGEELSRLRERVEQLRRIAAILP